MTKLTLEFKEVSPRKDKALSSAVFTMFKKRGFPSGVLKAYWDKYPSEYMCRKFWLGEYKMEQDPPRNYVAYMRNQIEYDHPIPENFHYWWKLRKPNILKTASPEAIKVAGVV